HPQADLAREGIELVAAVLPQTAELAVAAAGGVRLHAIGLDLFELDVAADRPRLDAARLYAAEDDVAADAARVERGVHLRLVHLAGSRDRLRRSNAAGAADADVAADAVGVDLALDVGDLHAARDRLDGEARARPRGGAVVGDHCVRVCG